MKEVFQSYSHYSIWIGDNWERVSKELNDIILSEGLVIEKKVNCTGQTHRKLNKKEFDEKQSNGFIFVPKP